MKITTWRCDGCGREFRCDDRGNGYGTHAVRIDDSEYENCDECTARVRHAACAFMAEEQSRLRSETGLSR